MRTGSTLADVSAEVLLKKQIALRKRALSLAEAKDDMRAFMRVMMPDTDDPDDADRSAYQDTPQGRLFCDIVRDVAVGKRKRVGVSVPPQHGKTIHLSTFGPAWIWGRDPKAKIVVATYNEDRAGELGDDILEVFKNPLFQHVFPDFALSPSNKSKTSMRTTLGGKLFFVGQGSGTTGKTADIFIIDDPIKDDIQVQSDKFREDLWKWFFSVAYSRGSKRTRMIVLHTRWHEDDLLGRLCDPSHPERNALYAGIADDWDYLNIPGVITEEKLAKALGLVLTVPTNPRVIEQFGEKPMCALWEEDKDLLHFSQWKRGEKRSFGALVMGEPTPDDGAYFYAEDMVEYDPEDLPANLRKYGASDHAVSTKNERDPTVIGSVGVDERGLIWILPDLVWERMDSRRTVDELCAAFERHDHMLWWMEDELISKSFGPFLREQMSDRNIFTPIMPVRPHNDKQTRARSAQGMAQLRRFRFPRFAPWWMDARSQLLRFPYGAKDDFVDFLAHVANGLDQILRAGRVEETRPDAVPFSTNVVLLETLKRASKEKQKVANDGW